MGCAYGFSLYTCALTICFALLQTDVFFTELALFMKDYTVPTSITRQTVFDLYQMKEINWSEIHNVFFMIIFVLVLPNEVDGRFLTF